MSELTDMADNIKRTGDVVYPDFDPAKHTFQRPLNLHGGEADECACDTCTGKDDAELREMTERLGRALPTVLGLTWTRSARILALAALGRPPES